MGIFLWFTLNGKRLNKKNMENQHHAITIAE